MLTSIVIPTFNKLEFTQQCVESIRNFTQKERYEIIIVDNCSTDGTVQWLESQCDIRSILNEDNYGFPKACNQGIELAKGDNILLLNNDTVVTNNWLQNLITCLYSNPSVGAVGAISNSCSYFQTIEVQYNTLQEMQRFAEVHNHSNPDKWEERVKLVGFCMLIKTDVIRKIGLLDEDFSPGNYEDDDYSLRIRLAGYRLLLCKDTFIHHYGSVSFKDASFDNLLDNNRAKFIKKWGFDPDKAASFKPNMKKFMPTDDVQVSSILTIDCGIGGGLLEIQRCFPEAALLGYESNEPAAEACKLVGQVESGDLGAFLKTLPANSIDLIIFSNLEIDKRTKSAMSQVKRIMKPNGCVVAFVANLMHFENVRMLIAGTINRDNLKGYNYFEINSFFENEGFNDLEISGIASYIHKTESVFIDAIHSMSGLNNKMLYQAREYVIQARMENHRIHSLLQNIDHGINLEMNIEMLLHFEDSNIVQALADNYPNMAEMLTKLANYCYENGNTERVIPFLQKAIEIDEHYTDALYNLGTVLHHIGENELALHYLHRISDKDNMINELIKIIESVMEQHRIRQTEIVFAMRRIEQLIDQQQSLNQIMTMLFRYLLMHIILILVIMILSITLLHFCVIYKSSIKLITTYSRFRLEMRRQSSC